MIKIISKNKFRFQRGYSYISVAGIPFLVARELSKIVDLSWTALFLIGLTAIWLIGLVDDKIGLLGEEQAYSWSKNPEWMGRK